MTKLLGVRGFRFSGVSAGIKKNGELDLALAVAEAPVAAAAVFTQNLVQAAAVRIARRHIAKGRAQVALVNSGNANACTGKPGMQAALATCKALARALHIDASLIVPASTGVIGKVLPADRIEAAVPRLLGALSEAANPFSRAILTTDNGPKIAQRSIRVGKAEVTLLGMAKGAGMIHPRMATTLGYVFTDARIAPALLARSLRAATEHSFNIATVDGETSTNDMLLVMASGASDAAAIKAGSKEYRAFQQALDVVLRELAEMIVADGEGAQHVAEIVVSGARSDAEARKVAQRVATSLLVKTAMHGKDANWGRILSAAGMAGVKFDPDRVSIQIGGVAIVKNGTTLGEASEREAAEIMAGPRYEIALKIGIGKGRASYLTCDVGHKYIDVNAGYRS
jgi:glutamate N-acetyltransferase/amino-acid N-acetyltransferase